MRRAPNTRDASPRRTCVGCRHTRPQHELVRIVRTPSDQVQVDLERRVPGRGAYICPSTTCVVQAARRDGQAIRRALRGAPSDQVRAALDQLHAITEDDAASAEHLEHRRSTNA